MHFNSDLSTLQQKMAASSAGVNRRQEILTALSVETGQSILDIGCGGGHLIEDLALAVGPRGKALGLDPSESQLTGANKRCVNLSNVELLCRPAEDTKLSNNSLDSATSTQTLEYIKDVDMALCELARVIKPSAKFVNVSILWDHFRFHGPETKLNNLIHEAFRAHCFHQMLPLELETKLSKLGFKNFKNKVLAFLITKRHSNSPAQFSEEVLARFAIGQGVSETKVLDWRSQLATAEKNGTFGFTSFPVLTEATFG